MNWLKNIIDMAQRAAAVNANTRIITASVPNLGSFNFHIHTKQDRYISGDLLRDKIWEPFETEIFRRLCRHGDFVLDIGANIGWYSVIASKLVGENGRVMAFEPDRSNFELLERNIVRSSGDAPVECRQIALGDTVSRVNLFLSSTNLGDHQIFDDKTGRSCHEVEMQTLDALFYGHLTIPTIVKSDTQGSEGRILDGAERLLSTGWRPIWLLEFWPYGLTNSYTEPKSVWARLNELGYEMYEVSEANPVLHPFSEERLSKRLSTDLSPASMGFINILALPSGHNYLQRLTGLSE